MELNEFHKDALAESINIGVGESSATLSEMLQRTVDISIPKLTFIRLDTLKGYLDEHYEGWNSSVIISFEGGLQGDSLLIFTEDSAKGFGRLIGEAQFGDPDAIDPTMEPDLLLELGNILLNGCIGGVGNLVGLTIQEHLPQFVQNATSAMFDDVLLADKSDHFGIIIHSGFGVEPTEIKSDLVLTLHESCMPRLLEKLDALVNP